MVNIEWLMSKDNSLKITYFTGIAARNPSGNTDNIDKVEYQRSGRVQFTTELTYDATERVINASSI